MCRVFIVIFSLVFLISCAGFKQNAMAKVAWMNQPTGSRGAFKRCMFDVSNHECGSSNVKDPAIEACMIDILATYRSLENIDERPDFLIERGCRSDLAQLRPNEL